MRGEIHATRICTGKNTNPRGMCGESVGMEMAKRFTDTTKWDKRWYRELGATKRDVLQYLYDKCDVAGFWDVDVETMHHFTGVFVSLPELMDWFPGRLVLVKPDKIFIPSFIEFQYGTLSYTCNPHQAVFRLLEKHEIDAAPFTQSEYQHDAKEGYLKGTQTLQDKDKDKDSIKGDLRTRCVYDFEALYKAYPRKAGKSKGVAKCKSEIKSPEDYEALKLAIKNYSAEIAKEKTETKFVKHFSTFMNCWRDYLEVRNSEPVHPFAKEFLA